MKLAIIATAFLLISCASGPDYDFVENAVVVVGHDSPRGAQGAGTFVGNGKILTAAHLVRNPWTRVINDDNDDLKITDHNGGVAHVKVVWVSKISDLAVLQLDDTVLHGDTQLELSCDVPPVGADVFGIGHPGMDPKYAFTWGRVATHARGMGIEGADDKFLAIDAAGGAGDSGGPFLYNGKVFGVISVSVHGFGYMGVTTNDTDCDELMKALK